jgi:hypothetical protein
MADVKLNNNPVTIRLRRGLRAAVYKPDVHYNHAEVPEGELLYVTDSQRLYYTNSTAVKPVQTVDTMVVHESDFVFHENEPVVND